MSTAEAAKLYTPEDLLTMPDGDHLELVNGQPVERDMSQLSSWIVGRLNRLVGNFVETRALGWVLPASCGYQCFPDDPSKVRRPDASFISRGRLPDEHLLPAGHVPLVPDWAAEVVSPNDLAFEIDVKVEELLAAGVRLVWVVHPETRTVTVVRPNGSAVRLHENDELSGEEVIPGFRCRVGDLFPPKTGLPGSSVP